VVRIRGRYAVSWWPEAGFGSLGVLVEAEEKTGREGGYAPAIACHISRLCLVSKTLCLGVQNWTNLLTSPQRVLNPVAYTLGNLPNGRDATD
jgi:hypothetical protein